MNLHQGFAAGLMTFLLSATSMAGKTYYDVAVYSGPGVCSEKCDDAAAEIPLSLGFGVRYVNPKAIQKRLFESIKFWIQPGGDAIEMAQATSPLQKQHIRDWIASGGNYLGICAGAFFADSKVDDDNKIDGLDLIPGETFDFVKKEDPLILAISWMGVIRSLYYQQGPSFRIRPGSHVEVLASYADGNPAVIRFPYRKGQVILSGPHPEAPKSWVTYSNLHDPDGTDLDLGEKLFNLFLK